MDRDLGEREQPLPSDGYLLDKNPARHAIAGFAPYTRRIFRSLNLGRCPSKEKINSDSDILPATVERC